MAKMCAACNEKVGFTSYKIEGKQIICGNCMKKAGYGMTTPYKVLRLLTLDDLKKSPEEKIKIENINIDVHQNLGSDRMTSEQEMADFCERYGYGSGMNKKWTLKHFSLLSDNLSKDEYAIFCFVGLHNYVSATKHDSNYAYALTNKRLIIAQQKMVGNAVQSILLEQLNDVMKKRNALMGVLTIDTLKETVNVGIDKFTTDRISDSLNEILYNLKKTSNIVIHNVDQPSNAEELRTYKNLFDEGIITKEEFEAKKAQILGL